MQDQFYLNYEMYFQRTFVEEYVHLAKGIWYFQIFWQLTG